MVSLLLGRTKTQLLSYVFSQESKAIETLLDHVYEKSVADLLCKLLTSSSSSEELPSATFEQMSYSKQMAIDKLVSQLCESDADEQVLSAGSILRELATERDTLRVICKRENLRKLVEGAARLVQEGDSTSKVQSLMVLNQVISGLTEFARPSFIDFYTEQKETPELKQKLVDAKTLLGELLAD
mmetsp:Transcript_33503/g.51462  ORF Transcript_33503/g.51462 Transcript_33503/m.51462 type:complete len:184 (+) Transcript_33503:583-1134(+)